jgi:hypothetical protein
VVTTANGQTQIAFGISKATDVEVAILAADGKVVRHLAAGLLGKHAPEPFQKDSLDQILAWDGKDDAGQPAAGAPFQVRVRVGSRATLGAYLGRDENQLSSPICAITVNPAGELFVLLADAYRGRSEIRVLDREGAYRRTIVPYPANTPEERTEPVGHVRIHGRRQPLVFNGQGHTLYPLVAGLRGQTMAWHPEGYLLAASSVGSMCNHGPPRFLLAFHPEGGAPEKTGYVGPRIRAARGFMGGSGEGAARGMDRLAVSPDGQWIYLVQDIKRSTRFQTQERHHGVYRLKWTDREITTPWLGRREAGAGDDEFNDPSGLAVDRQGRLFVCDRNNNRVKVYSPDGQLLGKFDAPRPEQIAIHPTSGEIYLMCRSEMRGFDILRADDPITSRILKLAPWTGGQPEEVAKLEFNKTERRVAELIALDASASPARLWVSFYRGWRQPSELVPYTDMGALLEQGKAVGSGQGLHYPSFLAADPQRDRVIVYEHLTGSALRGHKSIDLRTGDVSVLDTQGCDLAIDRAGRFYVMDRYNAKTMSRYDSSFQPLPFRSTGENKLHIDYRAYGPCMGLRGHQVMPNGDIYVRRSPNHARIATVDVFTADGKVKQAGLIRGAGSGDSGVGVDNRGNIYLGMNLKPADKIIPEDFAGAVPSTAWRYYRDAAREPPWRHMYANPYIFHMGSVFKFGPEGGRIYGNYSTTTVEGDVDVALDKAPADAVAYKSGYTRWDVKVSGAKWRYPGVGIIPHSFDAFRGDDGCECLQTQLDADLYGRVYAPSVFYSSVEMLDSAGNRIARIGAYGNGDSLREKDRLPAPEIAFAWPTETDYAEFNETLYVTDSVNRCVVAVRFEYADQKTAAVNAADNP